MNATKRSCCWSMTVLVAFMLAVGAADAATSCHSINAKGVGTDNGNFTTQATVIGGGLLHGTTFGAFSPTGVNGTAVSFTGTVTVTTNQGSVVVAVNGMIDVISGQFVTSGPIASGTGKLAGATGQLTFSGVEDLSALSFVEDIGGMMCVDLAP